MSLILSEGLQTEIAEQMFFGYSFLRIIIMFRLPVVPEAVGGFQLLMITQITNSNFLLKILYFFKMGNDNQPVICPIQ